MRQHNATYIEDLFPRIDKAKSDCGETGSYAGKPLAHNESGALVMSFIELWRRSPSIPSAESHTMPA